MYQGFYDLASGMLTQSRNLNVISNNMVNVQTAGYKQDRMVSSTFQEEMIYRTGRQNKGNPTALATSSRSPVRRACSSRNHTPSMSWPGFTVRPSV